MKSKTKRILTMILCFALAFVLGGEVLLSAFSVTATAAEIDISTSDPLDDLNGATVLGEAFDPNKYYYNDKGETRLISFLEYGFGLKGTSNTDYNLYFYVYNPKAIQFEDDSRNKVLMVLGENNSSIEYPLKIAQVVKKPGYEGLFYKFYINLDTLPVGRSYLLNYFRTNSPSERVYKIVSLSLYSSAGLEYLAVGNQFTYSGFMKGYGPFVTAESSLCCVSTDTTILTPTVYSTYYRPPYLNNADKQTDKSTVIDSQDSLHSVYFSVPNSIIKKYGKMTRVKGSYTDALTAPILVCGDRDVYKAVESVVGKQIAGNYSDDVLKYRFFTDYYAYWDVDTDTKESFAGYAFNYGVESLGTPVTHVGKYIDTLYLLFPTKVFGLDMADSKKPLVSSEDLKKKMIVSSTSSEEKFYSSSGLVYATKFFEEIADEETSFDVSYDDLNKQDDLFDLVGQEITKDWWSKLGFTFGETTVEDFGGKGIKAIQAITDEDFKETIELTCDSLYISEADYDHFLSEYNRAKQNNETLYLLRYRVSNYYAEEAFIFDGGLFGVAGGDSDEPESTNAVICQEHCDLGFRIIECHFTKDGVTTIIPVAMAPQDIIHDITGAVNTTSDKMREGLELLVKLFLGVIVILILIFLFNAITPLKILLDMCIKGVKVVLRFVTWPIRFFFGLLFRTKK